MRFVEAQIGGVVEAHRPQQQTPYTLRIALPQAWGGSQWCVRNDTRMDRLEGTT